MGFRFLSTAAINAHAALTNPHSAAVAATANRLVLRDSNGRAAVADPDAAGDIATKGYVDAGNVGGGPGANWIPSAQGGVVCWVRPQSAFIGIRVTAQAGAEWGAITGALQAFGGMRPEFVGTVYDSSAATWFQAVFQLTDTNVLEMIRYDNGTALVAPFVIGAGDQVVVFGAYTIP